ncbi:hypothetical protein C3F31_27795, partial [Escherichia coli]
IYWDERPSNNAIYKSLLRLGCSILIKKYNSSYYKKLLRQIVNKKIDNVFILNPEAIDHEILQAIKKTVKVKNEHCKFIMYLWDSVNNKPKVKRIINQFDSVFTFERDDAEKWGVTFLPLFYSPRFDNKHEHSLKYDLCFIGTAHSDRVDLVNCITAEVRNIKDINAYTFFYFQNEIIFKLKNLLSGKKINTDVEFEPLSQSEVVEMMKCSEIIIDIHHPRQRGLTMRTIECIGLNKKIITTNEDIKKYDFYDPNMICVVKRHQVIVPENFINAPNVNYKNREQYSLQQWVKKIISPEGVRE